MVISGSKRQRKNSWLHGRTASSKKQEIKDSLRRAKKELNRKIRHSKDTYQNCDYKKVAKELAYKYLT